MSNELFVEGSPLPIKLRGHLKCLEMLSNHIGIGSSLKGLLMLRKLEQYRQIARSPLH